MENIRRNLAFLKRTETYPLADRFMKLMDNGAIKVHRNGMNMTINRSKLNEMLLSMIEDLMRPTSEITPNAASKAVNIQGL